MKRSLHQCDHIIRLIISSGYAYATIQSSQAFNLMSFTAKEPHCL